MRQFGLLVLISAELGAGSMAAGIGGWGLYFVAFVLLTTDDGRAI